jgi:diguanylate cyclase (GGDEF)-like protein
MQKYQQKILNLIVESHKNEEKYRLKLEYDELTKVHSRAYINEIVNDLFGNKESDKSIALAILDLDNFKSINDKYGHDKGDIVLRCLGNILNEEASDNTIVGRFGGEEFVIILKDNDKNKYTNIVEKIREDFSKFSYDFMERNVTFSCGLVLCPSCTEYEFAFKEADKALYESKNTGKNKITVKEI